MFLMCRVQKPRGERSVESQFRGPMALAALCMELKALPKLGYFRKIISNCFHPTNSQALPCPARPGFGEARARPDPAQGTSEILRPGPGPDVRALLPDIRAGPRPVPVPARW